MMFYKKNDKLLNDDILNKICKDMGIQPTKEVQEYFLKDTMRKESKLKFTNYDFELDYIESDDTGSYYDVDKHSDCLEIKIDREMSYNTYNEYSNSIKNTDMIEVA